MILSNECYLKDKCWKYHNSSKECEKSPIYCPKLFKTDFLYNEALLSQKQRQYLTLRIDSDGTDKEAFSKLKEIQGNILDFVGSGSNLYLHSRKCGNGKTAWALRLLQSYIDKVWYKSDLKCVALFINVPRYLLALKDSISSTNEYIEHVHRCVMGADLVIFDEVATKPFTSFEHEHILNLINTRLDMNKSNIYTSNVCGAELESKIGERLYSRIVNLSHNIELFGSDKRGLNK